MATTRVNATAPRTQRADASGATVKRPALPAGFTAESVARYARTAPKFEDGFLACAQLPFVRDNNFAPVKAAALKLGMVERAPNYFEGTDGSWLARLANGAIERGVGNKTFQGVPLAPGRIAVINPQMSHFKLAVADASVLALKTPDAKLLAAKGFKQTAPNVFAHADKSFVAFAGGKAHFGVANQLFSGPPSYAGLPQAPIDTPTLIEAASLIGMPKDVASAKAHLLKEGFRETRNNYFALDAIWVAFEGSKVHMGLGEAIFAKPPTLDAFKKVKSDPIHGGYAVAKTADLTASTPNLAKKLAALKFKSYAGGIYDHADGSWVLVQGSKLLRGFQEIAFSDVPKPIKPGEHPVFTQLPSRSWDWYTKNTALGRTPVIGNAQQAASTLPGLGYRKTSANKWTHPDGSWFSVEGYGVRPGFQKWHIGQLPYNNRIAGG